MEITEDKISELKGRLIEFALLIFAPFDILIICTSSRKFIHVF